MINTNRLTTRILRALAILGLVFLVMQDAKAQEWYVTDQVTVLWDAVTTLDNGDPLTETPLYHVYVESGGVSRFITGTAETQQVITFSEEGTYWIGVSAVRLMDDGALMESNIAWSNNVEVVQSGATFGIRHYLPPARPTGLRK